MALGDVEIMPTETLSTDVDWGYPHFCRGRVEGRAEAKAEAVLRVLAARQVELPPGGDDYVRKCREEPQVDLWLYRAAVANSAADLNCPELSLAYRQQFGDLRRGEGRSWPVYSSFARANFGNGALEGYVVGRAEALLRVLDARYLIIPDATRDRITSLPHYLELNGWIDRAAVATRVADVFD